MKAGCFTVVVREKQHTLRTGKPEQLRGLGAQGRPLLPGPGLGMIKVELENYQ